MRFGFLLQQDFGRVPLGYEELFRRKQEQWAHQHHHHNRPSQSSPIFTIDFGAEVENVTQEVFPLLMFLNAESETCAFYDLFNVLILTHTSPSNAFSGR